MSEEIFFLTNTDKIAEDLSKRITGGEFPLGHKLPSFRALASEYDVSSQVIQSASKILIEQGILMSMPRIGLFVRPDTEVAQRKKMAVLSHYFGTYERSYLWSVLQLNSNELWSGIKQQHYFLPSCESASYDCKSLQYELDCIMQDRPDIMLVDLMQLECEAIELLQNLPIPVVFIGDLNFDFPLTIKNQIVEDTPARAEFYIKTAKKLGAESVSLVGGALSVLYCAQINETAKKHAKKNGIRYRYYSRRGYDSDNLHDIYQVHQQTARELSAQGGFDDIIIFDGMVRLDFFIELLNNSEYNKLKKPEIISPAEITSGLISIHTDYSKFSAKAAELIRGLMDNPGKSLGKKVLDGLIQRKAFRISDI